MTRTGWGTIVIGLTLLASTRARAQAPADPASFGAGHQLVVSSERLFGFVRSSQTNTQAGADTTTTVTTFSLLGNAASILTLYSTPRLALDGFVSDRLSLGAAASFFTTSESVSGAGTAGASSPTITSFALEPRVGYALALGPSASFWPRLGFTYVHVSESDGGNTSSLFALTIEAPLVLVVAPHFFVSVAPTVDVGLGGSTTSNASTSVSSKETEFGLQCGLGGFF